MRRAVSNEKCESGDCTVRYSVSNRLLPMNVPSSSASTLELWFLSAYEQYADAIFRHCALRLGDREQGRDLMQETFIRAWESVRKGVRVENCRAFLYKVANNLIIDIARRRKLRTQDSLEALRETGFDLPDREPGPARKTEGALAIESMQKLEEPYRTVLVMRFIDGLSPTEIAAILKVSENVISVRIHRGLEKLESAFNPSHE